MRRALRPQTMSQPPQIQSEPQARQYAFKLLSFRPRTCHELAARLQKRGCSRELADSVVADLVGRGYLDDEAYARQYIEERQAGRPTGRKLLVWQLLHRGVGRELADSLVDELISAEAELEAARRLVQRKLEGADRADLQRAFRALQRRGFSARTARTALELEADSDAES